MQANVFLHTDPYQGYTCNITHCHKHLGMRLPPVWHTPSEPIKNEAGKQADSLPDSCRRGHASFPSSGPAGLK